MTSNARSRTGMLVVVSAILLLSTNWVAGAISGPNDWCSTQAELIQAMQSLQDPPPYLSVRVVAVQKERSLDQVQRVFDIPGGPLAVDLPLDWNQDPYNDRSWRFWVHSLYFLEPLLQRYSSNLDRESLLFAKDIALDWIDANLTKTEGISEFVWYDMAVGSRIAYLAFTLRSAAFEGTASREELCRLGEAIEKHADWLMEPRNYNGNNNHGLYQDAGLFAAGALLPWHTESESWVAVAQRRFAATIQKTLNIEEGVHLEHSPAYHATISRLLKHFRDMGLGVTLPAELPERMDQSLRWFVMPDGRFVQLGDTDLRRAGVAGVPEGLMLFKRSGYGVVREDGNHLVFAAAYHSSAHKHSDELSFSLAHEGRRFIVDAGRYGYYYDTPEREFVVSSRAHNTMIFGGEEFSFRGKIPYGSGLIGGGRSGDWYLLAAKNPLLGEAIRHERFLFYQPSNQLVIIDRVEFARPVGSTRFLHFQQDLTLARDGEVSILVNDAAGRRVAVVCILPSERNSALDIIRGQKKARLQGFTSPANRVMHPNSTLLFKNGLVQEFSAIVIDFGSPSGQFCRPPLNGIEVLEAHTEGFQVVLKSASRSIRLDVKNYLGATENIEFSIMTTSPE